MAEKRSRGERREREERREEDEAAGLPRGSGDYTRSPVNDFVCVHVTSCPCTEEQRLELYSLHKVCLIRDTRTPL